MEINPVFAKVDLLTPAPWGGFGREGAIEPTHFASPITNFYMTDPISRASVTMAKCTETFLAPAGDVISSEKTGTHG